MTFSSGGSDDNLDFDIAWQDDSYAEPAIAKPSVSIVIPCYNHVAYTEACLRAVQETLPGDLGVEIVVVDDASTDETPQALRDWSKRDARITVAHHAANLGFIASCNRGAEVATGDLL